MQLDENLLVRANSIVANHPELSSTILFLSSNPITRGLPVTLVLWFFWFVQRGGSYPHRAVYWQFS